MAGRVVGRSGLAFPKTITNCSTVDSVYHGTVSVIAFNFSRIDYNIEVGDGIAQIIFEKHYCPRFVEVSDRESENIVKDESNDRKEDSFGSIGK